ncbi:MAG: hypothetical protein WBA93_20260 [Microcoleaceae cyanobacterium]
MANQKCVPLNQITSAEVRPKLENLTGRKTRLRGVDRVKGKHYKSGHFSYQYLLLQPEA